MELEFACASETLLHLKFANVAVNGLKFLYLDHIFFGLSINDDDIPVAFLDKGIVFRANVAWSVLFFEQIVLNVDCERDDVASGDRRFSFHLNFLGDRDKRHGFDAFLELVKLCFISAKEAERGALIGRQSAESLDFAVWDLVLANRLAVFFHFSCVEAR